MNVELAWNEKLKFSNKIFLTKHCTFLANFYVKKSDKMSEKYMLKTDDIDCSDRKW